MTVSIDDVILMLKSTVTPLQTESDRVMDVRPWAALDAVRRTIKNLEEYNERRNS